MIQNLFAPYEELALKLKRFLPSADDGAHDLSTFSGSGRTQIPSRVRRVAILRYSLRSCCCTIVFMFPKTHLYVLRRLGLQLSSPGSH